MSPDIGPLCSYRCLGHYHRCGFLSCLSKAAARNGTWRLGSRHLDHSSAGDTYYSCCSVGKEYGRGRPEFNGPPGRRNVCRSASPAQPRELASHRCSFEPNLEHGFEQLDGGCETPRASDQDFPSKATFCDCRHRPNRAAILLFHPHCGSIASEGPERHRSNACVCKPAVSRKRR